MPFVAKLKSSDERVDITSILDIKDHYKQGDFVCPYCNSPLVVRSAHQRKGFYVSQHFIHVERCTSDYDFHPESAEHLYGKLYLRDALRDWHKKSNIQIELEFPIEMPWRERGRIADVIVIYPMGWREVHEVQLSPITIQDLEERTNDYLKSGVDVTWWLGGKADTRENRLWCATTFGESYSLSIESSPL